MSPSESGKVPTTLLQIMFVNTSVVHFQQWVNVDIFSDVAFLSPDRKIRGI